MSKPKQLSNPASTGGLGVHFENRIQASFVVLMLTEGFAPCLRPWPITKIELQRRYEQFHTDDVIVYTKQSGTNREAKLLGQIKHSININKGDKRFGDVIHAAWNDFNNKTIFTEDTDVIALICGPLSATDTDDVRALLKQAKHSKNAADFNKRVELGKFTSEEQRDKLKVFKHHLKVANNNRNLTDNQLYRFMKSFHLLIYDLDIKGVTLSLLHSLIGQYSSVNANALWTQVIDIVEWESENAGQITIESIPDDIRSAFQRATKTIPSELSRTPLSHEETDWNQSQYAFNLVIANLLGTWNEKYDADREIVRQLANEDFGSWIVKIREILQQPVSPITLKNGIWRVTERDVLWRTLGARLFDGNLDCFKQCVVNVLTERDPQFDLPIEERYTASIHGNVLKHSPELRNGLAESLALLGNKFADLTHCSQDKPETVAIQAVREIFMNADWALWGSLNNILPVLAEAAPDVFLDVVEAALQQSPCPFDELFSQEGDGITGGSYLTGLLWALETLAWDEKFLVRVSVILGDLASHDPGGNWANRPVNSLTTIFLPWLPQTMASIDKRKVALQTLQKEVPAIGWKLLLSLLPNQHQTSSSTHKPSWRNTIPDDWEKEVTNQEYWEQVSFHAKLAVSMANQDMEKLKELVGHLDKIPQPYFDTVLEHLSSETISRKPEDERLALWNGLTEFTIKHRRLSDAKWALSSEIVSKIEDVAAKLAPTNLLNRHRRLFGEDFNLYEENGNWKEQRQKLEDRRQLAIKEILASEGINAILQFVEVVESPSRVGQSLGVVAKAEIDVRILPALLETKNEKLAQFANGYVWSRQYSKGLVWVDGLDRSSWSITQIGRFLSYMPFTEDVWNRATEWLGTFENEYWSKTSADPYHTDGDIGAAIDKLIEYGRPRAAINCLHKMLNDKHSLNISQSVTALLAAVSSKEHTHAIDTYILVEIIKALQEDPCTDPEDLFRVEWAYVSVLDQHSGASPKLLESRLASDPNFFCEVIRLIYISTKEPKSGKQTTDQEKAMATNAWRLLREWSTQPGTDSSGGFSESRFKQWLKSIKETCTKSGHIEVALSHVGNVLIYAPPDSDGLWINHAVAEALNSKDADKIRNGFRIGIFNSRGAYMVDPTGKPEKELAAKYRKQADDVENVGYQRFAATLRDLADSYEREAESHASWMKTNEE